MTTFDILFYCYLLLTIFYYFNRKDLLSPGQIVFFFVIVNIFLYLRSYSDFIKIDNIDPSVYFMFIAIIVIFLFITLFTRRINVRFDDILYRLKRPKLMYIINVANIVLVFVENLVGSGTLIPTIHAIDIHTFSMPIISLFTRSIGFLLILNYIHYANSKKKTFVALSFIVVLLPMVTRAARMTSVIAIVQFVVFYIIMNKNRIHNNFKQISKFALIGILIVVIMTAVAEYRMVNYNDYHGAYSETIKYTGYEDRLGVLPMYYGYFVLGYENLNLSIKNIKSHGDIYTNGLYTFAPVFVGIFQFDNLFSEFPDRDYANTYRLNNVSTATVPTGFFKFFLDFGDFAFLSIIIYGFLTLLLYNKIRKNKFYASYYSILAGAWALMSFQNVLIEATTLYNIIFLFLFSRILLAKNEKEKKI